MSNDVLTVKDLAAEWGVTEQTIYNQVKRGEIPCFYVGRNLRFHRNAINTFMGIGEEKQCEPLKVI